MPRQPRRTLSPVEKAKERLAAIKNINPNLDMGRGLSVQAYAAAIEKSIQYQEICDVTQAKLNADRITKAEADKELNELSEKMLLGVAIDYGKDSLEYEKAGGTRKSKRKRSTRKKSPSTPTEESGIESLTR